MTGDFDPSRVVDDLRELNRLTADRSGADRLCWTPGWERAREWLRARLDSLPCTVEQDPAGNLWATLPGDRDEAIIIGSHLDAVPNGGWLDGTLGVVTALEVLRSRSRGCRPHTIRLVDWADEEGARFGTSLFGSSSAAGSLGADELRGLRDVDGELLPDVLRRHGVELDSAGEAARELAGAAAYLELHIEQGPVLERAGAPVAAVSGTYGISRHLIRFAGPGGHAGGVPMELRKDVLVAASTLVLAVEEIARRHGCLGTVGAIRAAPSIPTAVNRECEVTIDVRALEADILDAAAGEALAQAEAIASGFGLGFERSGLMRIEPVPFDPGLLTCAEEAVAATLDHAGRDCRRLVVPSGALHDATAIASRVPTVMLFTSSVDGLSHVPDEDTAEGDLLLAAEAYSRLFDLASARLVAQLR